MQGIEGYVLQHQIIAWPQMRKVSPVAATIEGFKQSSGSGAEQNVIRVGRIIGQRSCVASKRSQGAPLRPRASWNQQQ
jgi:hypothetical protein